MKTWQNQTAQSASSDCDPDPHLLLLFVPLVSLSFAASTEREKVATPTFNVAHKHHRGSAAGGPPEKEPIITYQESLGVIKDLCRLLQVENINE